MSDSRPHSASATTERSHNSIGDLLGEVTRNFSALVRQEVQLAKAEVRQEAKTAGRVAGMVAVAAIAGLLTLIFLSSALWWGLSNVMDQGWAALIVGAIWAVIGVVLVVRARKQLRQLRPLPRTQETVRDIPNALRGR
jgi:uncharacterized membrane protein